MHKMYKSLTLIFSIAFISSSWAVDYTNNDLSTPVADSSNYTNATVTNNRTLSSGSVLGGYLYLGGSVSGDVSITNTGSITSTHSNYGVFYLPTVGNISSTKTIAINNEGALETTGNYAIPIYILGKNDGSFPDYTKRSFDFQIDNSGTITSASEGMYIVNGNSGSFEITNSGTFETTSSSSYRVTTYWK